MTRFGIIGSLLAFTTLGHSGLAQAEAPRAPQSFSAIQVDTSALAHRVGPHFAARIQQIAGPVVQQAFAGRVGGRGPVLVLRIDDVNLGPITGEKGGGSDWVRGAALVVADHRVVASYPVRGAPQSLPGNWTQPDLADQQRLTEALAFLAGWARREMGL